MFFKEIPGKEREKATLIRLVNESKIPHAQLLLGKEGSGALPLAFALISYILCTDRSMEDSCGHCKNCIQSHKKIHPDVHFSYPVVKKEPKKREETTSDDFLVIWRKVTEENPFLNQSAWQEAIDAENSKPNINTRECLEIIKKLSLQAFNDGPKIVLMWLPEFLGKEGNRLLKLIEEPTDDTFIILVAEDQSRILNTILSRCQITKIYQYQESEIAEYLVSKHKINTNIANQMANVSSGNMAKALNLVKGEEKDYTNNLFEWLRVCYKGDSIEISEMVNRMASWSTDQQIQFFEYGLHFLREYGFWLNTNGNRSSLTDTELETAQKMKSIIDLDKIEAMAVTIDESMMHILRNGNIRINFTADCILIGDILRNKSNSFSMRVNFA